MSQYIILESLIMLTFVVKNLFGFTNFQGLKLGMHENVAFWRKVTISIWKNLFPLSKLNQIVGYIDASNFEHIDEN